MSAYKINFTKAALQAITCPQKSDDKKGGVFDSYKDTKEKGLVLLVSNGGAKTFYLYRKINGKPERIKLGTFPETTVEQARNAAMEKKSRIVNKGENPNEDKKKIKAEITFGEMFTQFMNRYSKPFKRSWQYDEREVNKFLSHWFKQKASRISKQEIQRLHESVCNENGLYQANRLLERIRAIYNKTIEWGWEGSNPTIGIKKFKEKSRDRFIQPDELPRFFASLAEEENETIKDYVLLSIFTGARKSNVLAMRWDEICFNRNEWRIPETKNGDSLNIPLVEDAVVVLKKRSRDSEYVFPGHGKSGHLQDPKKGWARILKRADIDDLRIHDIRRTMGSYQAITGASLMVIGKSLGHKSQHTTQIYARLHNDPVRASMEKATEEMFKGVKKNNE